MSASVHVAYAFVPLGFVLVGAAIVAGRADAERGAAAWTAGAIGTMTLAMMTRTR